MNRIIILLALMLAVPFAWLVFGKVLDLNAAVSPSGPEDALFDNLPQIRAVTIIGTKSCVSELVLLSAASASRLPDRTGGSVAHWLAKRERIASGPDGTSTVDHAVFCITPRKGTFQTCRAVIRQAFIEVVILVRRRTPSEPFLLNSRVYLDLMLRRNRT